MELLGVERSGYSGSTKPSGKSEEEIEQLLKKFDTYWYTPGRIPHEYDIIIEKDTKYQFLITDVDEQNEMFEVVCKYPEKKKYNLLSFQLAQRFDFLCHVPQFDDEYVWKDEDRNMQQVYRIEHMNIEYWQYRGKNILDEIVFYTNDPMDEYDEKVWEDRDYDRYEEFDPLIDGMMDEDLGEFLDDRLPREAFDSRNKDTGLRRGWDQKEKTWLDPKYWFETRPDAEKRILGTGYDGLKQELTFGQLELRF